MTIAQILVVEDDSAIRDMLAAALGSQNYAVDLAADAHRARQMIMNNPPDLILLDWMLPGQPGIEFVRALKREQGDKAPPVIMLTARDAETDKVAGLESGCEDYISKPFSVLELLARIKVVLRRSCSLNESSLLKVGGLSLNLAARRVQVDGQTLKLAPMEYELLQFMATHAERVYSRAQLLDQVWGESVYVEERTVDVHILRLRKILQPFGLRDLLQTSRGAGYRFSTQV
ncbi:MAG: phosphate regulon transcriptional regulator PhoB [gamma proteobacterium symbiont of Bathyaustriella thionipta]|nr:phosphate regulon transcriptional regulator PhoB [gamma proteobacterium symbiont of Bathyaustriella thionipta]